MIVTSRSMVCLFIAHATLILAAAENSWGQTLAEPIRVGIIGLDTSHAIAFTKILNEADPSSPQGGCRVVCAFPQGSRDIESSVSRIDGYTEEMRAMGVEIVDSIDALITRVDAVLLETNDGRPHLEQAIPVLKSKRPVFIDKPMAGSLADVLAIFEIARRYDTPVFSSSALRFSKNAQAARNGELVGSILGCDTFSPCSLEPTHPDLYWYGIHGVEQLVTVMGTGCQSVVRVGSDDADVVVGTWGDGRLGTFRGMRSGPSQFGGIVFGTEGQESSGGFEGYEGLVAAIAHFFASGEVPVTPAETIEIYAFMSAADESLRRGGVPVSLERVLANARAEMERTLEGLENR